MFTVVWPKVRNNWLVKSINSCSGSFQKTIRAPSSTKSLESASLSCLVSIAKALHYRRNAYVSSNNLMAYTLQNPLSVRIQRIVDTRCIQRIVDISAKCIQRIVDIGHTHLNLGGELCPRPLDQITKTPNFAEPPSNGIEAASLPPRSQDNSTTAAA